MTYEYGEYVAWYVTGGNRSSSAEKNLVYRNSFRHTLQTKYSASKMRSTGLTHDKGPKPHTSLYKHQPNPKLWHSLPFTGHSFITWNIHKTLLNFYSNIIHRDISSRYRDKATDMTVHSSNPARNRNSSFLQNTRTGSGIPASLHFNDYRGSSRRSRRPKQFNHSSPYSAVVSIKWSHTSTAPYTPTCEKVEKLYLLLLR